MSNRLRSGHLFEGYGGLSMAVDATLGAEPAWHSEIEPAACRVLEHHWPDVPNLGDITTIDWTNVEPVDVLTGGFPCQDVSSAGKRAGMRPDSRSGLWTHMARAINVLRPQLVVIENVRGLLSADAACDVEPCPWCLGDGEGRPLRALGAVLGDLAVLGYDARWCGLRAADAGAPHGRFRVFVTAWPAAESPVTDTTSSRLGEGSKLGGGRDSAFGCQEGDRSDNGPTVTNPQSVRRRKGWPESARLVRGPNAVLGSDQPWGDYAPAIARWERAVSRPAPAPTQTGNRGGQQLSPRFVEWLMGLDEGHVTEVPGLSRNEQLKLLGNGVVPQQAALALHALLTGEDTAERDVA